MRSNSSSSKRQQRAGDDEGDSAGAVLAVRDADPADVVDTFVSSQVGLRAVSTDAGIVELIVHESSVRAKGGRGEELPRSYESMTVRQAFYLPSEAGKALIMNPVRGSGIPVSQKRSTSMCDYSLHLVANRPAKIEDKLVATKFDDSMTRGFAAVGQPNVAVCLCPVPDRIRRECRM